MNAPTDNERYLVPALVRGVEVLRLFSRERPVITPTQMATELSIPRSTVFRLVHTLEHLDLIAADGVSGAYRLGPGLMELGLETLSSQELHEVCQDDLEQLRNDTGCSTHLAVLHQHVAIVVMKISGRSAFSGSLNIGTRLPAHATALGRCLLIDHDEKALRQLFGTRKLKTFSDQTPSDVSALQQLLVTDRNAQYVISQSFFERGISSIAAPVRDHTGNIRAAISITLYGDLDVSEPIVTAVVQCAQALSQRLHYRQTSS